MPRSKTHINNLIDSILKLEDMEDVRDILLSVLNESIIAIPYSSTLKRRSYTEQFDREYEHSRAAATVKQIHFFNKFGSEGDIYATARWLLAIEKTQAENCGGIALDAHYRCKKKGLNTNILSLANEDGSQQHVVLTFKSKGKSYIFDVQHGDVYPFNAMTEKLKLWDSDEDHFVPYNSAKHKSQPFLSTSYSLEQIDTAKYDIQNDLLKYNAIMENAKKELSSKPRPSRPLGIFKSEQKSYQNQKPSKGSICIIS
ncbi:MAG: hypothetical protein EP298_06165 [Gammaproteobacteria bacterium]|nr:MAG: hypothetical protein EP298_06165 [Gammaproteobacteria bacterium]UTW41456.1 hypothetical protein KFE69_08005 [bacterium SCSIO 12844]